MRFRLRTLLIVLALGPPVLAGTTWLGFVIWVNIIEMFWPEAFTVRIR